MSLVSHATSACLTTGGKRWDEALKGKGKGKATLFIHGLCLKLEACGAVYMKQISNKHNMIKIPTGRRQTSWLFTSMTEDLNSGQPRTNSDGGQNGT